MDHIDIPLHFRKIKENIKDIKNDQRIYLFQGWHKSTYKVQINSSFYRHSRFELNPILTEYFSLFERNITQAAEKIGDILRSSS